MVMAVVAEDTGFRAIVGVIHGTAARGMMFGVIVGIWAWI